MVVPFWPDHRDDQRRAQGGAAASARLRRGRAAAGQPQGPGRLRLDGRQAGRADDRRGASQRAPRLGLLLEEGGEIEGDPAKPRWIVDPLDGTTNFLHGLPHFSISIAVEERRPGGADRDQPGPGLSAAYRRKLLGRERAAAPGFNDARLRVSARRDLADSADRHRHAALRARRCRALGENLRRRRAAGLGIRRFGSAALDLAWVAAGRLDGFWEDDLDIWDTAAGMLLVREAGGFVTDYRGSDRLVRAARICRRLRGDPFQAAKAGRRARCEITGLCRACGDGGAGPKAPPSFSKPWSIPLWPASPQAICRSSCS